jgi:hypothetical protein
VNFLASPELVTAVRFPFPSPFFSLNLSQSNRPYPSPSFPPSSSPSRADVLRRRHELQPYDRHHHWPGRQALQVHRPLRRPTPQRRLHAWRPLLRPNLLARADTRDGDCDLARFDEARGARAVPEFLRGWSCGAAGDEVFDED